MHISMMEAYIVESLKKAGFTLEQIMQQLEARDLAPFQAVASFDFTLLQAMYEQGPEHVQAAFEGNYRVKFLTVNGLKNLLQLKFGIEANQFVEVPTGIAQLQIDEATEEAIKQFVSTNWHVQRDEEGVTISV